MCEEYNGWSNRETWATALWIDNERELYEEVQEEAREIAESVKEYQFVSLANRLEEMFDRIWGDGTELSHDAYNMFRDIGSLYRVDWCEIAKNILSELEVNA